MIAYRSFHPVVSAALVIAAVVLGGTAARDIVMEAAAAQECDCSCEAFAGFTARMEELRDAMQSGEAAAMTPEMQQAAVCGPQCAMQWSQCGNEGTSDAAGGSVSPATGNEATSGGDDADNQADASFPLGEPRDDLERFYGVYGDGESGRDFFVTAAKRPPGAEKEIPPGYLMIGAMWGDLAPWYMKSVSETRFEQQWVNPGGEPIVAGFELDDRGDARAIVFETVFDDRGTLKRLRDLPEGW